MSVAVKVRTAGDARVLASRLAPSGRSIVRDGCTVYIEGGLATVSRLVTRTLFHCPAVSLVAIEMVKGKA